MSPIRPALLEYTLTFNFSLIKTDVLCRRKGGAQESRHALGRVDVKEIPGLSVHSHPLVLPVGTMSVGYPCADEGNTVMLNMYTNGPWVFWTWIAWENLALHLLLEKCTGKHPYRIHFWDRKRVLIVYSYALNWTSRSSKTYGRNVLIYLCWSHTPKLIHHMWSSAKHLIREDFSYARVLLEPGRSCGHRGSITRGETFCSSLP